MPFNQNHIIEQAKFTYSLLVKAFEKETETLEEQTKEQVDALKVLKPNNQELIFKSIISEDILNE